MNPSADILHYLQDDNALTTLRAGLDYAESGLNWSLSDRAQLYEMSVLAFGPEPNFASFHHIYSWMTKYWKINRGGGLATPKEVFSMLIDGCTGTSRQTGCTLLNSDKEAVMTAVRAMSKVKSNAEYPHMAASKFLHFYNPSLFPIYDDAIIWKRVLHGAFRHEWANVCRKHGIKVSESSEKFLITYFSWAAEVMDSLNPDVTIELERRIFEKEHTVKTLLDTVSYYAATFEYLLIGLAHSRSSIR